MLDDATVPRPEDEGPDDGSKNEKVPSEEMKMVVGSFEQVTDDLSIRYAEKESFDVESWTVWSTFRSPQYVAIVAS